MVLALALPGSGDAILFLVSRWRARPRVASRSAVLHVPAALGEEGAVLRLTRPDPHPDTDAGHDPDW